MAEALAKSGSNRSAVRAVCLAVSGVNHPSDQQRILDWLRYYFQVSMIAHCSRMCFFLIFILLLKLFTCWVLIFYCFHQTLVGFGTYQSLINV